MDAIEASVGEPVQIGDLEFVLLRAFDVVQRLGCEYPTDELWFEAM